MAEIFYFEGIDDILIAPMTSKETSHAGPDYDTEIWRLPIATELSVKGNGTVKEKWASSKMFRRASRETKHELGLKHVGMPIELVDLLKDAIVLHGVEFAKSLTKEFPFFAFGFIGNIEGGNKKAVWYPKTQISITTDETYKTEGEEQGDIEDVTLNMVATALSSNSVLHASYDSTRATAEGVKLDDFIRQPVFDENQWEQIVAGGGA